MFPKEKLAQFLQSTLTKPGKVRNQRIQGVPGAGGELAAKEHSIPRQLIGEPGSDV